ncbi:MAG: acylphosphatase [Lysobacterales bacterium]|jgi:acylphosphatase
MNKQFLVVFTGNVQGVFFRATTQRFASECGVDGWVRNFADGRVLMLVQASEYDFNMFMAKIENKYASNIDEKEVEVEEVTEFITGFEILH